MVSLEEKSQTHNLDNLQLGQLVTKVQHSFSLHSSSFTRNQIIPGQLSGVLAPNHQISHVKNTGDIHTSKTVCQQNSCFLHFSFQKLVALSMLMEQVF